MKENRFLTFFDPQFYRDLGPLSRPPCRGLAVAFPSGRGHGFLCTSRRKQKKKAQVCHALCHRLYWLLALWLKVVNVSTYITTNVSTIPTKYACCSCCRCRVCCARRRCNSCIRLMLCRATKAGSGPTSISCQSRPVTLEVGVMNGALTHTSPRPQKYVWWLQTSWNIFDSFWNHHRLDRKE